MSPLSADGLPIGECTRDPERWTSVADEDAKAICRMCPRRWACAREACELPRAEGLWAGIVIPEGGGAAAPSRYGSCDRWPNATVIPSGHAGSTSSRPETGCSRYRIRGGR